MSFTLPATDVLALRSPALPPGRTRPPRPRPDLPTPAGRGAEVLDEYGPAYWWQRVDLVGLRMGHPSMCVLGQLYGDYGWGWEKLASSLRFPDVWRRWSPGYYGFTLSRVEGPLTFWGLGRQWKREVRRRLAEFPA